MDMGAHSSWGMSGQSIIFPCPGSVNMQSYGEDSSNRQSELGTAVHEMGEFAFRLGVNAVELKGLKFNGFKVNNPMIDAAQQYLDVLKKFSDIEGVESKIENKVCISSIDPKRLWGTADYQGVYLEKRILYIGDYKNGYVHVEVDGDQYVFVRDQYVTGNVQCIGYALGVLDTDDLWEKVDHVVTFIVQPNKDHVDGVVRSETYTIDEMRVWWQLYKETHHLSLQKNAPRKAGKHCRYCKARGYCSTRISKLLNDIQLDTTVAHASPDQLIAIYEEADTMINAIESIKENVVLLARKGHKVPNHKLVKGIARAVCEDQETLVDELKAKGFTDEQLHNKKLKGKTDLKSVVGKENIKLVNDYYKTPKVGLSLVKTSDARVVQRPDKMANAVGIFKPV